VLPLPPLEEFYYGIGYMLLWRESEIVQGWGIISNPKRGDMCIVFTVA
jgi:hypothetical protein